MTFEENVISLYSILSTSDTLWLTQKDWSQFYVPGGEIQAYLERVVDKFNLWPYIRLQHRIISAEYDESAGKWRVTIRKPKNSDVSKWDWDSDYEEFEDTADVIFAAVGSLSRWSWPEIEGLEQFTGKVIHSAQWKTGESDSKKWEDTITSWGDKRVGVIGVVCDPWTPRPFFLTATQSSRVHLPFKSFQHCSRRSNISPTTSVVRLGCQPRLSGKGF